MLIKTKTKKNERSYGVIKIIIKLLQKQGVFDNFLKIAITLERMRIFENGFHH